MSTETAIEDLQHKLGASIQRAQQAGDRELSDRVRHEGHRLVFLLNGLLRTTHLYHLDNAAFEAPTAELAGVIRELLELLGAVHLVCVEDQIYLNDIRLRVRPSEQHVVAHLVSELGRHDVGGISIHTPLDPAAIKAIAFALASPAEGEKPRAALMEKLARAGDLELTGRYRFRVAGEPEVHRRDYAEAMARGASVVREAVANLAAARTPNPLPVRRAVIDLVELIKGEPGRGVLEPIRRRQSNPGEQHIMAVCSLAVLLGQALGLPDGSLSDLGVAAMLHDAGYTLNNDRTGHTAGGARLLLRQRGFHEAKIRRLLVVLEHHLPYRTGGGEAECAEEGLEASTRPPVSRPSLFSRILHIVDDYDVLTSPRPGQLPPLSPAAVLGSMWAARGSQYDPDLMVLFVQRMGLFPPGTLLELTDGRWVVSVSGARDQERFRWPEVRVVREADGSRAAEMESIDLYEVREQIRPKRVITPAGSGIALHSLLESLAGADHSDPVPG